MRRGALVVVAAVLAVACTGPRQRPDRDRVPGVETAEGELPPAVDALLTGRVVEQDGSPPVDATALLRYSTGEADPLAFVTFSLFLGGLPLLACVDEPPNPCDDEVSDIVAIGPDGRYEAVMPLAHVPGYETNTDWYFVASRPPAAGQRYPTTASYELEVAVPVQEAPDLVLWQPAARFEQREGRAVLTWTPVDADAYDAGTVAQRVSVLDPNGLVLMELDVGADDGVSFDGRVLEDQLAATALTTQADVTANPTIYHQVLTAPGVDITGPGPAPSRGAACVIAGAPQPTCPLTDGDLLTPALGATFSPCVEPTPGFDPPPQVTIETIPAPDIPIPSPETIPPPDIPIPSFDTIPPGPAPLRQQPACPTAEAVIDLGAPTPLDLVVIRGSCSACDVATSVDGTTFATMPDDPNRRSPLSTSFAVRAPAAPVVASFVRLSGPAAELRNLREVSAWPTAAAPAPGGDLAQPATDDRERFGYEWIALIVAVALVAVAAVVLHQRSQRR